MKLYRISMNSLKRRKGKVFFLVFGLSIGIATIVTLISVTESMTLDLEDRLDRFGANIVMTPKNENLTLSYGGVSVGGVNYQLTEFNESDLAGIRKIKNSKNLGIIAPKVLGPYHLSGKNVLLMGVDLESELALKTWWQFDGKYPETQDELLIGAQAARAFNLKVGDRVDLEGGRFHVSSILNDTGGPEDSIIIGDLHALQSVLGKTGKVSLVEISAFCRGCPITEITLQIAEKFPDAKVTALRQAVMSKMQSIDLIKSFSFGIALLVIFIGSLLVFVTMMGSVNERTREIGIFRAIGFRRGHIMQVILLEAMIVGLLGGFLGFFIGNGVAWSAIPLVIANGTFSGINPALGGISILLSVSLSLLASLYPALKASRLDPSMALRAL